MGLDMYLTRKTYVKNLNFQKEEGIPQWEVIVNRGGKSYSNIDSSKVKYVEEEVGYWRKANAIHSWFVKNVQNGNDDCGEYWVDIDTLKELSIVTGKQIGRAHV